MSRRPAQDATSATGRVYSGPVASVTKLLNRQDQSLCMHVDKRAKLDKETTALATCKRTDLLMAANYPKRAAKGSQHVFALDELNFDEVSSIDVHVRNSDPHKMKIYVPNDYAQYQCDVYDARDHVELSLAMKQACIIDMSGSTTQYYSPSNRVQTNKEYTAVEGDKCKVLRKNVFVVDPTSMEKHPTLGDDLKEKCTVKFVKTIAEAYEQIFKLETKPSVTYAQSEMSPPMITYAGIAMTDAYYNASNGDPFVTSNLYSLITMLNGPHDAVHGDPMHWIWRIEQNYYEPKTGLRRKRRLWYNTDQHALWDPSAAEKNDVTNLRDDARLARIGNQFQMVPLKLGFDLPGYASRFGVLDGMNQRKVGIAQSNALKLQSMDITNCGKCIN